MVPARLDPRGCRGYTRVAVSFAVIAFEFDPYLRLDRLAVSWETLGLAVTVLLALVASAMLARRRGLRLDDLLYIGLGIVPGAIIGGRIGYVLLHADYYSANPGAIFDAGQGSLQLSLAVVGGTLTGMYVARLIEAPAGRWLHVAAIPLLLAIEGGKLTMAWGGRGQGLPSLDGWATAYLGPGPWGSLAPALPSIPSQILEGLGTGLIGILLVVLLFAGAFARGDGRLFLVGAAGWLVVRFVVAGTWRDPEVLGPLRADQIMSLVLLIGVAVGWRLWPSASTPEVSSGSPDPRPHEVPST